MQFVKVKRTTKLTDLREMVGTSNLEPVLNLNQVPRVPNVGEAISDKVNQAASSTQEITLDYKKQTLSTVSKDEDVFENLALMGETGWRVYKNTDALPGTLKIPESIKLPSSENIIGNSRRVPTELFKETIKSLDTAPHTVDPALFNTYDTQKDTKLIDIGVIRYDNLFQFFKIPWGKMTIYSSIANEAKDFPVYPEELTDATHAVYTTMPDLIYQYEPWYLYQSSGPRNNTYTFMFHRDMWTGDHRDGKANELIRFCMANCYPEYNGSAVNSSLVTLYMNGQVLIRGILTDVQVTWDGPLGLDGYFLACKLQLNIVEVSDKPLNYWSVMNKPLIG